MCSRDSKECEWCIWNESYELQKWNQMKTDPRSCEKSWIFFLFSGFFTQLRIIAFTTARISLHSISLILAQSALQHFVGDCSLQVQMAATQFTVFYYNSSRIHRCPRIEQSDRPPHRGLRPLLFSISVWSVRQNLRFIVLPYPRRLESLTICRWSTFSSVIWKPWVLVRPGLEPATSRTVVRHSTNWANR